MLLNLSYKMLTVTCNGHLHIGIILFFRFSKDNFHNCSFKGYVSVMDLLSSFVAFGSSSLYCAESYYGNLPVELPDDWLVRGTDEDSSH